MENDSYKNNIVPVSYELHSSHFDSTVITYFSDSIDDRYNPFVPDTA